MAVVTFGTCILPTTHASCGHVDFDSVSAHCGRLRRAVVDVHSSADKERRNEPSACRVGLCERHDRRVDHRAVARRYTVGDGSDAAGSRGRSLSVLHLDPDGDERVWRREGAACEDADDPAPPSMGSWAACSTHRVEHRCRRLRPEHRQSPLHGFLGHRLVRRRRPPCLLDDASHASHALVVRAHVEHAGWLHRCNHGVPRRQRQ